MQEPWQTWMPLHINAWQSSASVQGLSDLAFRAMHNLMLAIWQSVDCSLPADDKELAKKSRTYARWAECRDEVLDYFDNAPEGKITHPFLVAEWIKARRKYEANHEIRSRAGKKGNETRWLSQTDRSSDKSHRKTIAKLSPEIATETLTGTGTETKAKNKQKPSRDKRESPPDLRHEEFKGAFVRYFAHRNNGLEAPWDGQEGAQLLRFLKKNPNFTTEKWKTLLQNRARSDVAHAENLSTWISRALTWANEPTKKGNLNGKSEFKGKTESSLDALAQARAFNREQGSHHGSFGEVGREAAGEVITPGLPHPGRGLTAV